jgi:hypothetical protein
MAETLGSLCDKLTILLLKQWHSQDQEQLKNIALQKKMLQEEIDEYTRSAVSGLIPFERLSLPANKVYQKASNRIDEFHGDLGETISQLAFINCQLWHQQEMVYEFEAVPITEKDTVIKQLAILNLERTHCIDQINCGFALLIKNSLA